MRVVVFITLSMVMMSLTGWHLVDNNFRKVHNDAFQKGEFLKYRVHYGIINAGFAELEVEPKSQTIEGRPCYHLVARCYTNQTFSFFYKLEDIYESYVDEEALFSWRFNRLIQEGKYYSYTETHFDQRKNSANYVTRKKEIKRHTVPRNIQDVVSAFYYARAKYDQDSLKIGDRISLKNFIDEKTVNLEAVLLKRETIKVEGHKYKALKFALTVDEAGLITDGSKIRFWISDDDNKVPIRIVTDLAIGKLKVDLMEHRDLMHPFIAKLD